VSGEATWLWWTLGGAALLLVLVGLWVWQKGRPFAAGEVFRASRLSTGNRFFPTQVSISHMAHVSSVKIDTGVLFSDVLIETSGGSHPIRCHGHRKRDAIRMKTLIEQHQTEYYRRPH
jgi:hypothetical protein